MQKSIFFILEKNGQIFIDSTSRNNINRAISSIKYKYKNKEPTIYKFLSQKMEPKIIETSFFQSKDEIQYRLSFWKHKYKAINFDKEKDSNYKLCKFNCFCCNSTYKYCSDYLKHLKSIKHKKNYKQYDNQFNSDNCIEEVEPILQKVSTRTTSNFDILKESMDNLQIKLQEIKNKPVNNIINNQTNFNVMNYLNTQCNNAPNIYQFINSLPLTLQNCKDIANHGFLEPFKETFIKALTDCEQTMRPIHCTDIKRNTCYIKNAENIWIKDNHTHDELYNVFDYFQDKHIDIFKKHKDSILNWIDTDENLDFFNTFITNVNEMHRKKSGEGPKIFKKLVSCTLKENKLVKL